MKLLKWKWKHNKSWHWNWFSDAAGSDPRLLQPPEGMIISSGSETDHWKLLVLHWFNMRLVPQSVPRAERGTVRLNQSFVSLETSLSILPFILSLLNSMAWGALAGGQTTAHFHGSVMARDIGYTRPQGWCPGGYCGYVVCCVRRWYRIFSCTTLLSN